jgi:hypothetical protein
MKQSTLYNAIKNILKNDRYFEELSSRPVKMAETAALKCFMRGNVDTDDANVIRSFLNGIYENGFMHWEKEDETV